MAWTEKQLHSADLKMTEIILKTMGNPVALETFHNTLMGTGRDEPRVSSAFLAKKLGVDVRQIYAWEGFWRRMAAAKGWDQKPSGGALRWEFRSAVLYARKAGWNFLRLAEWVREKMGKEDSVIYPSLGLTLDLEMLKGRRSSPRPRPSLRKIARERGTSFNSLYEWARQWEKVARLFGVERALRPPTATAAAIRKKFKKGDILKTIFAKASRMDIPAFKKAQWIFDQLVKRGFLEEAAAAANILEGLHDGDRLPPGSLAGDSQRATTAIRLERRLEELAEENGIPLKKRAPESAQARTNRRLGLYLEKIRERSRREGETREDFVRRFRDDPVLPHYFGEYWTGMADLLQAVCLSLNNGDKSAIFAVRAAFVQQNLSLARFRKWRAKFEEWLISFGS